jgi:hypothetical protein
VRPSALSRHPCPMLLYGAMAAPSSADLSAGSRRPATHDPSSAPICQRAEQGREDDAPRSSRWLGHRARAGVGEDWWGRRAKATGHAPPPFSLAFASHLVCFGSDGLRWCVGRRRSRGGALAKLRRRPSSPSPAPPPSSRPRSRH